MTSLAIYAILATALVTKSVGLLTECVGSCCSHLLLRGLKSTPSLLRLNCRTKVQATTLGIKKQREESSLEIHLELTQRSQLLHNNPQVTKSRLHLFSMLFSARLIGWAVDHDIRGIFDFLQRAALTKNEFHGEANIIHRFREGFLLLCGICFLESINISTERYS